MINNTNLFINDYNNISYMARRLLKLIEIDKSLYDRLSEKNRMILQLYFYINNPIVSRMVKLKYKLPLSSIFLKKPVTRNPIIQDYVFDFYENMIDSIELYKILKSLLKFNLVYGKSYMLVEDNLITDTSALDNTNDLEVKGLNKEDREFLDKITEQYNKDSFNVSYENIEKTIGLFLSNYSENSYSGIEKISIISPFNIKIITENKQLNYVEYEIPKSEEIVDYINRNRTKDEEDIKRELIEAGYGKCYVDKHFENKNSKNLTISNDSDDGIWIEEFLIDDIDGENDSEIRSILRDLIRYDSSLDSDEGYSKIKEKKTNLIKIPEEKGEDEALSLENRMKDAMDVDEEISYVVTNYDVEVKEVTFTANTTNENKDSVRDEAKDHIIIGTGTPDSLLNGDDSYGSSYIKLDLMNTEYNELKNAIKDIIENKLFKVVAKKAGFIEKTIFNKIKFIYPTLSFTIGSLINNEDFISKLDDLADDGLISKSTILSLRGIDAEDEMQKIVREKKIAKDLEIDFGY